MTNDFKVGDLVTKNPDTNTKQITDGVVYEVVQTENNYGSILIYGGDLEARNREGGNSNNDEVRRRLGMHIWNISPSYLIYVSECYTCIHACKMREKCGLYEGKE